MNYFSHRRPFHPPIHFFSYLFLNKKKKRRKKKRKKKKEDKKFLFFYFFMPHGPPPPPFPFCLSVFLSFLRARARSLSLSLSFIFIYLFPPAYRIVGPEHADVALVQLLDDGCDGGNAAGHGLDHVELVPVIGPNVRVCRPCQKEGEKRITQKNEEEARKKERKVYRKKK